MKNSLDIFKIKSNNIAPKKGRILIAEPFLPGNYFSRSVVFIVAYSEKGTVGFILNKHVDLPVNDVITDIPEFDAQVYLGGPVSTDSLYFIHKLGEKIPGSIHVLDDLYWGGDFEALVRQMKIGLIKTSDIRFFLGYSGWDAGQLEKELHDDSWLVCDADQESILQKTDQQTWFDFVKKVGNPYTIWEHYPENPSLN